MTPTGHWRFSISRIYWDSEENPSVEVPVGDFFCVEGGGFHQASSLPFLLLLSLMIICLTGGQYRWHITDPIRFDEDLKLTIHALGWRSGGRYLPL